MGQPILDAKLKSNLRINDEIPRTSGFYGESYGLHGYFSPPGCFWRRTSLWFNLILPANKDLAGYY